MKQIIFWDTKTDNQVHLDFIIIKINSSRGGLAVDWDYNSLKSMGMVRTSVDLEIRITNKSLDLMKRIV